MPTSSVKRALKVAKIVNGQAHLGTALVVTEQQPPSHERLARLHGVRGEQDDVELQPSGPHDVGCRPAARLARLEEAVFRRSAWCELGASWARAIGPAELAEPGWPAQTWRSA
jgi:hypothetical protein